MACAETSAPDRVRQLLSSFVFTTNYPDESCLIPGNEEQQSSTISSSVISKPLDRDLYWERISTYQSGKWHGKPQMLSPLECACYGWQNVAVDMLQCVSCGAYISGRMPTSKDPHVYKKCVERLVESLKKGHQTACPWANNHSPDHFKSIIPKSKSECVKHLKLRFEVISSLDDKLPNLGQNVTQYLGLTESQLDELIREYIPLQSSQSAEVQRTSIALALTGWSCSSSETEVLHCDVCWREVGLWNILSLHQDQDESEEEEPAAKRQRDSDATGDAGDAEAMVAGAATSNVIGDGDITITTLPSCLRDEVTATSATMKDEDVASSVSVVDDAVTSVDMVRVDSAEGLSVTVTKGNEDTATSVARQSNGSAENVKDTLPEGQSDGEVNITDQESKIDIPGDVVTSLNKADSAAAQKSNEADREVPTPEITDNITMADYVNHADLAIAEKAEQVLPEIKTPESDVGIATDTDNANAESDCEKIVFNASKSHVESETVEVAMEAAEQDVAVEMIPENNETGLSDHADIGETGVEEATKAIDYSETEDSPASLPDLVAQAMEATDLATLADDTAADVAEARDALDMEEASVHENDSAENTNVIEATEVTESTDITDFESAEFSNNTNLVHAVSTHVTDTSQTEATDVEEAIEMTEETEIDAEVSVHTAVSAEDTKDGLSIVSMPNDVKYEADPENHHTQEFNDSNTEGSAPQPHEEENQELKSMTTTVDQTADDREDGLTDPNTGDITDLNNEQTCNTQATTEHTQTDIQSKCHAEMADQSETLCTSEETHDRTAAEKSQTVDAEVKDAVEGQVFQPQHKCPKRRRRGYFHPLAEHQHWCPWVSGGVKEDGSVLPDWKKLYNLLQPSRTPVKQIYKAVKNTSPTESLQFIRHLFNDWTSPS